MSGWRLVCDVGGTNIRIGRSEGPGHIDDVRVQPTGGCVSLGDAFTAYGRSVDGFDSCLGAAVAAAGPIENGRVALTNAPLNIDRDGLIAALNGRPVVLLNDLEATAQALPLMHAEDVRPLTDVAARSTGPYLVVNVGTGFGAALLVRSSSGWQALATEAGHMTFAAVDQDGRFTSNAFHPVSIEDKLSGLALPTGQPFAVNAFVEEFGAALGAVCGNLVLATGAWSGVYLCGSVVSAWLEADQPTTFLATFRSKGRMSERMARVPVHYIRVPHPALIGLTALDLMHSA